MTLMEIGLSRGTPSQWTVRRRSCTTTVVREQLLRWNSSRSIAFSRRATTLGRQPGRHHDHQNLAVPPVQPHRTPRQVSSTSTESAETSSPMPTRSWWNSCATMSAAARLRHVRVRCSDMATSLRFYTALDSNSRRATPTRLRVGDDAITGSTLALSLVSRSSLVELTTWDPFVEPDQSPLPFWHREPSFGSRWLSPASTPRPVPFAALESTLVTG